MICSIYGGLSYRLTPINQTYLAETAPRTYVYVGRRDDVISDVIRLDTALLQQSQHCDNSDQQSKVLSNIDLLTSVSVLSILRSVDGFAPAFDRASLTVDRSASTVWVKKIPPRGPDIFSFFHKRLIICNRFFTHLLNVPIFARLQIFIQLSLILTKLCHIKRDYPPSTRNMRKMSKTNQNARVQTSA